MSNHTPHDVVKHLEWLRRAYLAIVICAAIGIGILFYLIVHQRNQLSNQTQEIQRQTLAIQKQRRDTLFRECKDTNQRHDQAINVLKRLLVKSGVPPAKQRASAQPVTELINALQPRQNCGNLVNRVAPKPKPLPSANQ